MVRFGGRLFFIGHGKSHPDEENIKSKSHNEQTPAATGGGVHTTDNNDDQEHDVHSLASNQKSRTKRYPVTPHPNPPMKKKHHSIGDIEATLDSMVTAVDSVSLIIISFRMGHVCFVPFYLTI
jgi:hypothetical protein